VSRASGVNKSVAPAPVRPPGLEAGPVTRGDAPAVLAVAGELERILPRILLMDVGRPPAVLEVVAPVVAHELVLDSAEIDPEMRELVREERPRVQHLVAVDPLPLVGRAVGGVALGWQRERRRAEPEQVEEESLIVPGIGMRDETSLRPPA